MSYEISREIDFSYGHRLPEYEGKCRYLHGHNGNVELTLASETLQEGGMVLDFGELRSGIEAWINEELDHHTILYREDPLVPILKSAGQKVVELDGMPTAENIAKFIFQKAKSMNLNVVRVKVCETARNAAVYRE